LLKWAALSSRTFQQAPWSDGTASVDLEPLAFIARLRFRALSEIQGKQYTAVAELNVVGTAE
jgi:hypothetical protein